MRLFFRLRRSTIPNCAQCGAPFTPVHKTNPERCCSPTCARLLDQSLLRNPSMAERKKEFLSVLERAFERIFKA